MSLENREIKLFGGISRDFAGISQRRPKSLRKNVCVQFLAPLRRPFGEESRLRFLRLRQLDALTPPPFPVLVRMQRHCPIGPDAGPDDKDQLGSHDKSI